MDLPGCVVLVPVPSLLLRTLLLDEVSRVVGDIEGGGAVVRDVHVDLLGRVRLYAISGKSLVLRSCARLNLAFR